METLAIAKVIQSAVNLRSEGGLGKNKQPKQSLQRQIQKNGCKGAKELLLSHITYSFGSTLDPFENVL